MKDAMKTNSDLPTLDRFRFDQMAEGDRKLWGLREISAALGVSVDTARRWAVNPDCNVPISKPGGRWFALRSELVAWLCHRMQ